MTNPRGKDRPSILLINPWITDVAAFDLWAWPLGLLVWAQRLRDWGFRVGWIDCLDRAHPALADRAPSSGDFHTGKYYSELFEPYPQPARHARRYFRRYGLPQEAFEGELEAFEREAGGPPDLVLVTSRMTYWYHGVADVIGRCRKRWGGAGAGSGAPSIILGGIYATLCGEHARKNSGADLVLEGDARASLSEFLRGRFPELSDGIESPSGDPESWPRPAFDLCHSRAALPLLSSVGCPMDCAYCAAKRLSPGFQRRSAESLFREVADYHARWETRDFVFYDDALLVESEGYFEPFLDRIIESGLRLRFHTPNGVHYTMLNENLAGKMKAAGVETLRLSLETARSERLREWNRAGEKGAFLKAVEALRRAGYDPGRIGAYIMAGTPGQSLEEVRETIEFARGAGATPKLNEYSPIPGTRLWDEAVQLSGGEIAEEPLWQNNSLYYTREEVFPREEFEKLKRLARNC